jgi:hypothetical protein
MQAIISTSLIALEFFFASCSIRSYPYNPWSLFLTARRW